MATQLTLIPPHFRIANIVSPTFTNKHIEVHRDKKNELSQ